MKKVKDVIKMWDCLNFGVEIFGVCIGNFFFYLGGSLIVLRS